MVGEMIHWRMGVFGGAQRPNSGGILKVGLGQRLVSKHVSRNLCLCQMPCHCTITFYPKNFRIFSLHREKEGQFVRKPNKMQTLWVPYPWVGSHCPFNLPPAFPFP